MKLTRLQKLFLTCLNSVDGWMPLAWVRKDIRRAYPSLKRRSLIKARGGVGVKSIRLPKEVAITPAGRAVLNQEGRGDE